MTPEQKAAYVTAQAACAQIRIAAMQVQNDDDRQAGRSLSYRSEHFEALIDEFGLSHNNLMTFFRE